MKIEMNEFERSCCRVGSSRYLSMVIVLYLPKMGIPVFKYDSSRERERERERAENCDVNIQLEERSASEMGNMVGRFILV